jgi:DNA-binding NarL/FixJ family response regulator
MRVVLVGSALERARLRALTTDASIDVVGEAPTLDVAREFDADAFLLTAEGADPPDEAIPSNGATEPDYTVYREPLTRREIEVLELLAEGLPNKAIASRLGISDQTVKFHVSSIYGKLGAANRTAAVRRAVRRGLITL